MNARHAVFSYVAIKPSSVEELRARLPYASKTIYKEEEQLVKDGLLVKSRRDGKVFLSVAGGFHPQKLKEIYVKCLSHGVDPEMLLRDSTQSIWALLDKPRTVAEIKKATGLSDKWAKELLNNLHQHGLVEYQKRKPIVAVKNNKHILSNLLDSYLTPEKRAIKLFYPGEIPFDDVVETPEFIERELYELIKGHGDLTVKDTGFLVKGESPKITIFDSVDHKLSLEEYFLKKLFTTEGVEDLCVLMVKQGFMDYDKLLAFAKEADFVNVVGCYLDILRGIQEKLVPLEIVEMFEEHKTKSKKTLLRAEKQFGKDGWEQPYEERWNVDLYLERGGIEHGVRGL